MSDDGRTAVDSETTLQRNPYRNAAVVTAVAAAATLLPHLLLWGPPWHASSGSEAGAGAFINDTTPESVAARLREHEIAKPATAGRSRCTPSTRRT